VMIHPRSKVRLMIPSPSTSSIPSQSVFGSNFWSQAASPTLGLGLVQKWVAVCLVLVWSQIHTSDSLLYPSPSYFIRGPSPDLFIGFDPNL
uniref:Uncharacterized protein n=1 Tax=Cannabis sativa TaxID=3483 RepID=A0A803QRZ6_CANSA